MMFITPQWQLAFQLNATATIVHTLEVTDDDLDAVCRTLRFNGCQAYTVTPLGLGNSINTINQSTLDHDCGCQEN